MPIRSCSSMAEALAVAQTPYTLKFFELINSPQGPWLQGLQRVYFTDDPIDHDHRRHEGADEGDRSGVDALPPWATTPRRVR